MEIMKKQIRYNYSLRLDAIKYIVIHDTGNQGKGANADAHFNYFNGGDRSASANIFVDDNKVLEIVDCRYAAWHCGDGNGIYGITNHNSIGIEICVNSDGDYNKAFKNAIDVTKQLMDKYGISAGNVVRHYDASRKCCPRSMSNNNWEKWIEFKNLIQGKGGSINSYVNSGGDYSVKEKIGITTDCLNVRSGPGTSHGKIGELSKGESVKLFKQIGDWYEIYYGNSGGYVSKNYIKIEYNGGSSSKTMYLNLHPHMISWAVYKLNAAPIRGNQCGSLAPSRYGGLSYIIEGNPQRDVYIITTSSFGRVKIYAPVDKDSTISEKRLY